MTHIDRPCIASLTVLVALATGCTVPPDQPRPSGAVIYQASTINALLEGAYDGDVTCGELLARGDLGIGTLAGLDGELVVLDGRAYQVRSDGRVRTVPNETTTPLALIVEFAPTRSVTWKADGDGGAIGYAEVFRRLDAMLATRNVPYAIRIDGAFDLVRTRSVPRQGRPYHRLVDVVKGQSTFDLKGARGTLVGFWFPKYMASVNVPGYHFHFIDAARANGGHVLDCRPRDVRVQVQECAGLDLRWPATEAFRAANLERDTAGELLKVEK